MWGGLKKKRKNIKASISKQKKNMYDFVIYIIYSHFLLENEKLSFSFFLTEFFASKSSILEVKKTRKNKINKSEVLKNVVKSQILLIVTFELNTKTF